MADTNISGPKTTSHQGSVNGRQSFRVALDATAQLLTTVVASTDKPVMVEAQLYIHTEEATETVSIGTNSADYDNLINDADLATPAIFLPASNATGKLLLTENTGVYALASAGTAAAVITVFLDLATVNTNTALGN